MPLILRCCCLSYAIDARYASFHCYHAAAASAMLISISRYATIDCHYAAITPIFIRAMMLYDFIAAAITPFADCCRHAMPFCAARFYAFIDVFHFDAIAITPFDAIAAITPLTPLSFAYHFAADTPLFFDAAGHCCRRFSMPLIFAIGFADYFRYLFFLRHAIAARYLCRDARHARRAPRCHFRRALACRRYFIRHCHCRHAAIHFLSSRHRSAY